MNLPVITTRTWTGKRLSLKRAFFILGVPARDIYITNPFDNRLQLRHSMPMLKDLSRLEQQTWAEKLFRIAVKKCSTDSELRLCIDAIALIRRRLKWKRKRIFLK